MSDPYCYPGTQILKNLPGLMDSAALSGFETNACALRLLQLLISPLAGAFDTSHLRAIHKFLFRDVYGWAGTLRTVEMVRSRGSFWFARADFIASSLDALADQLAQEHLLRELSMEDFAGRAAHYLAELNAIHPFREGNGRTQREFLRHLALRAGWVIGWERLTQAQMYEASEISFRNADTGPLALLLGKIVRPATALERSVSWR